MMISTPRRILFAGGGTGGHLFPAIAIAERLTQMANDEFHPEIAFVGTKRGLEYRVRDTLGFPLHLINVRGLARRLTLTNLILPFIVVGALVKSYALLRRFNPQLIVGTGGYVCWPILKAAAFCKIPSVLQEQNSYPGITTRQMAAHASRIYLGFEKAAEYLPTRAKTIVTGNPVRHTILDGDRAEALKEFKLDPDKKTILILGGSQGARNVNNAILAGLQKQALPPNVQVLWQTGKRDYKDVTAAAGDKVTHGSLFPFSDRMDLVYAAADLAIARAGALTIAELVACGVPSILIPLPSAAGDHQRKNAREMAAAGVSVIIEESELEEEDPIERALQILRTDEYEQMCQATLTITRDREAAVDIIAHDIRELLLHGNSTGENGAQSS